MKQLFTFLLIAVFANSVFSQEQQLYTEKKVKEMAVFSGCERIDSKDKKAIVNCNNQKLSEFLSAELKGFTEVMKQNKMAEARADIQFVISKEGILIDIHEQEGSNPILADAAVFALNKVSENLPPIRPAKLKNGTPVNLVCEFPIRYQVELEKEKVATIYPVDEIVLFTLLEKDFRYEVRLFQNKDIKTYEIKNGEETFLGKFLTLSEVETSDPYKSLIEKEKNQERTLVTDGNLDDGFYEIYIHNLFKREEKKPIYVEVVKVENQKKTTISEFQKEEEFNKSRFAPLIYRD